MVMTITAMVNQADYERILATFWLKEDIDADLEVDGVLYKGGEISFRGTTSLNFPKKGFKIKFPKKKLYQGNTRRIDLSASYADKSIIRERLSFDLFGKTGVVASKAWHVDFIIENKTGQVLDRGLYTGVEHVDEYFFANRNRTIGTLYKADGGIVNGVFVNAALDVQPEPVLRILYAKETTRKITAAGIWANLLKNAFHWDQLQIAAADEEDYSDLISLIATINQWDEAAIDRYFEAVFDANSYLDWLAVNTLVQSNDTYHKNYYLHNRVEDNRWEIMPWDYDLSWGRNWNDYCGSLCDDLSEGTSVKGPNQMLNQLARRVLNNPVYFDRLRQKLLALLETEFIPEKLFAQIDTYYTEISPLAYADTKKWPTNQQFDQERDRLKDWITRRRYFLYKELRATPPLPALPDTVVTRVVLSKTSLIAGDSVIFEATVNNSGRAATGTTVGVAFLIDGKYITFGTAGSLAAGASCLIKSVSTWQATPGPHRLTAVVDDVNRYPELSEENNTLIFDFVVQPRPAATLSDVVVKDVAFERTPQGQIILAALIANVGHAITADVVGVAFLVNDRYATFGVIPPLPAGETKPVRAVQPLSLTGMQTITALADDVNRFAEENDTNNALTKKLNFGTPADYLADVIVVDVLLGQGQFADGDAITFEALIKNIGLEVTRAIVGVGFFIDGKQVSFGTTGAMPPQATQTIRAVSPWYATAGKHHLTTFVDDLNRFPELSEDNNRFELDFVVLPAIEPGLPDSTVDEIDFETHDDGRITLTATVSNIGTVATPDLVGVAFFVDDQYNTYGIVNAMPPGSTQVVKAVQSLHLNGTRTITALVNDVNRYPELTRQNNSLTRHITVTTTERRAIWITRYDWTDLNQRPKPERIDQMVANIARAGFNTIFFQVRAAGDAYYTPGLEPWSARLTGSSWQTLGENPGWDPLARMIEKAAATGIEVHAYLNVYSAWLSPADDRYGQLAPPATLPIHMFDLLTYAATNAAHPGEHGLGWKWRQYDSGDTPMQLEWGKYLWASPGVDQVQAHILAVIKDLVARYPLKGIHLDNARYAGPQYSYDPAGNQAAGVDKTAARDQWQRDRVTDLVRQVYTHLKTAYPAMWLSAAVWPTYRDKWGWKTSQGYSDFYQDSKGWLAAGIIDAIVPMLYDGKADDFEAWKTLTLDFLADSAGRHVYPGIGGDYDTFEAIAQRIEAARIAGAPGHAIFSYRALETRNYWDALANGPYATPVLPPAKMTINDRR